MNCDKTSASPIETFYINDVFYEHVIFCSDDDRVECRTRKDGEWHTLMTYTANSYVLDADKKQIGRFSAESDPTNPNNLIYIYVGDNGFVKRFDHIRRSRHGNPVLDAEIEISKLYIQGLLTNNMLKYQSEPVVGERHSSPVLDSIPNSGL